MGMPRQSTRTAIVTGLFTCLREDRRRREDTNSRRGSMKLAPTFRLALVLLAALAADGGPAAAAGDSAGSASGLPVPRYVSLKSERVNVRGGPTKDHDVTWVFTRAGFPVEVVAEYENWRRIRDWEGAEGWVYHSLLSGRRTVMVVPRLKEDLVPLYGTADADGAVTAKLQSGVVASVKRCSGNWCRIAGQGFDGWIPQERLWGVYPNEKVE
jgi:SH3-like domain-containing protein